MTNPNSEKSNQSLEKIYYAAKLNFKKNFFVYNNLNGNQITKYLFLILVILCFPSIYLFNSNQRVSKVSSEEIFQKTNLNLITKIENALNRNEIDMISDFFENDESIKISKKLTKLLNDFPNSKWQINKKLDNAEYKTVEVNVTGSKKIDGKESILESNFDYVYSINDGKIDNGIIKNQLTTIRSDQNKIDISYNIPNKVLTGEKYELDIIINDPLEGVIVAGGMISHQDHSLFKDEIKIEPLPAGGIFKITRAPSLPGIQIWSGILAHPQGIITFTKSVEIVDKI